MTTSMYPRYPRGRAPRRQDTQRIVVQLLQSEVLVADQYAIDLVSSRSSFVRKMYLLGLHEYKKQLTDIAAHEHAASIAGQ